MLDADTCYRALLARDRESDGRFFVAVSSTRIYCRPVCPARTPRRDRCSFYASAAECEHAGYVPCLLCRPELPPGRATVDAKASLAARATRLIERNWDIRIEELAARLGASPRQLRRALRDELGVSPREFRLQRRIAVARRLLLTTSMPITRVALASGFESLRAFNAAFRRRQGCAPMQLRTGKENS